MFRIYKFGFVFALCVFGHVGNVTGDPALLRSVDEQIVLLLIYPSDP